MKAKALVTALVFFVLCALVAPATGYSVEAPKSRWQHALHEQVTLWVTELAKQDSRFEPFHPDRYTTRAIGPNTKQWLITFQNEKGNPVGYLVAGQSNDKEIYSWSLVEYGIGEYSLYEESSINTSSNITPVYHNPFELYWRMISKGTLTYRQHLSGEEIPVDEASVTAVAPLTSVSHIHDRAALKENDIADPYDYVFWLAQPALTNEETGKVLSLLRTEHPPSVVFQATTYKGAMNEAFTVTGYHQWDNEQYISIEEQGLIRFIPYTTMQLFGHFYSSPQ